MYEPSTQTKERVVVGGERIPVINDGLTLHERKDGPMDITHFAKVKFPSQAFGTDWTEVVDALDTRAENVWDPVNIDFRNDDGEWETAFRGFVNGVSGGDKTENEMQMVVWDVGKLLNSISAYSHYSGQSGLRNALDSVIDDFSEAQPVFNDIKYDIRGIDGLVEGAEMVGIDEADNAYEEDTIIFQAEKDFRPNRHTLRDELMWIRDLTASRMWFEPYEDTVRLVISGEPSNRSFTNSEKGAGTQIDVLNNNILHQISPPTNTVVAEGKAHDSFLGFNVKQGSSQYARSVVHHPRLVNRVGWNASGKKENVNALTVDSVTKQAKSILKDRLDSQQSGSLTASLVPQLRPFDVLTLKPEWKDEVDDATDLLRYEVEELEHHVSATDGEWTTVHCSLETKLSDIEVISEEMRYYENGKREPITHTHDEG